MCVWEGGCTERSAKDGNGEARVGVWPVQKFELHCQ